MCDKKDVVTGLFDTNRKFTDISKKSHPPVDQHSKNIMQNIVDVLEGVEGASLHTDETLKISERDENIEFMKGMLQTITETETLSMSDIIRDRVVAAGAKFFANSNIADYIKDGEIDELINETTCAFEKVLDCLIIDRENDPNSMDTPRRLAKMYILEIMSGRYTPVPKVTAFPNVHTDRPSGFSGLLVVKSEIISMCSHHHQPVKGVVYTGIIPGTSVLGLSKYTRIAQHLAKRGTLQEELAEDIAQEIMLQTGSPSCAVYIEATHGCVTHRGVMAHDSTTQTTVVHGDFMSDSDLRREFHNNISFQKMNR